MLRAALLALPALLAAAPAYALILDLPGNAIQTAAVTEKPGQYALPVGAARDGTLPVRYVTGTLTLQSWRIPAPGLTAFQIIAPLQAQLEASGFTVNLTCAASDCGGYDFRRATRLIPAPAMRLDLSAFHVLTASNPEAGAHVSLIASRSAAAGYLQIAAVTPETAAEIHAATSPARAGTPPAANIAATLETSGRVILSDLTFAPGSATLGAGPFASLTALAQYLAANPDLTVALVGHTDSTGSLESNIALSRRRAAAVLERLATAHDVPRAQMQAQGTGYLAPIASNRTEEGRNLNRRVEVILTTTE